MPFAGYEMPVQYTSVMDEHLAVRRDAGLFDVSHMGLFEFTGEDVHLFLTTIAANDVTTIDVGGSQYSFLLAPDGSVVDDIWVYRLDTQRYWVVVNASNNDKDWAWITAIKEGHVLMHEAAVDTRFGRRNRADARQCATRRWAIRPAAQLALQGPKSRDILLAMLGRRRRRRRPDVPGRSWRCSARRSSMPRSWATTSSWRALATPASRWLVRSFADRVDMVGFLARRAGSSASRSV